MVWFRILMRILKLRVCFRDSGCDSCKIPFTPALEKSELKWDRYNA